jgi:eukaryotic translation initiation factor 2C
VPTLATKLSCDCAEPAGAVSVAQCFACSPTSFPRMLPRTLMGAQSTRTYCFGRQRRALAPADAPQGPLAAFGIKVSGDMTTFTARVLPPPTLSYKAGRQMNVTVCCPSCLLSPINALTNVNQDGGWNILDVKFHKAATLAPNWAVMVVRDGPPGRFPLQGRPADPQLNELIQGSKAKLTKAGLTVPTDQIVFFTEQLPRPNADPDRTQSIKVIRTALMKNLDRNCKSSFLLLVFLAMENNHIYPA